jgi:hypothetical protein
MREIRTSGSEGGGAGYSTGPPYPYPTIVPEGTALPGQKGTLIVTHEYVLLRDFEPTSV